LSTRLISISKRFALPPGTLPEHIASHSSKPEADVAFVREWLIHALVLAIIAVLVAITVMH